MTASGGRRAATAAAWSAQRPPQPRGIRFVNGRRVAIGERTAAVIDFDRVVAVQQKGDVSNQRQSQRAGNHPIEEASEASACDARQAARDKRHQRGCDAAKAHEV
jgi:hypothetical protein